MLTQNQKDQKREPIIEYHYKVLKLGFTFVRKFYDKSTADIWEAEQRDKGHKILKKEIIKR